MHQTKTKHFIAKFFPQPFMVLQTFLKSVGHVIENRFHRRFDGGLVCYQGPQESSFLQHSYATPPAKTNSVLLQCEEILPGSVLKSTGVGNFVMNRNSQGSLQTIANSVNQATSKYHLYIGRVHKVPNFSVECPQSHSGRSSGRHTRERGKRLLDNGYLFIRPRAKIAGKRWWSKKYTRFWKWFCQHI